MSLTRQRQRARISEVIIVVILVLLPLLFWWRLWALDPANRVPIPPGDFDGQYFPLQQFAAEELAEGRLPVWNPYINAGQPGLADIQTGFFYPLNLLPNLILAWLGIPFTLGFLTSQVIVHFSLASVFTYLFVRHLALGIGARLAAARFAGAVAALTFTYSGYLTSFPVQQLTILETAVWLPLVLFFLDRSFQSKRPIVQTILAGFALAFSFLAGHPQTAMYVTYATLAYGLYKSYIPGTGFRLSRILSVVGALVVGAGVAAVQLVPTLEFVGQSTRSGLDYESVAWGFPLIEMTHLLYPGFFGGSPQYVGIMAWILAAASLLVKRTRRDVIFWMIFAGVAFLLAFGGHTFLYNLVYLVVPGFGVVRNQERIIYLFAFAMSVLSGYGALVLVQPLPQSARKGFRRFVRGLVGVGIALILLTLVYYLGYLWGEQQGVEINLIEGVLRHQMLLLLVFAGAVLVSVLRLTGKAQRRWIMALTLGLIWLNLFTVNWRYNQVALSADGVEHSPGQGSFVESGLVAFLSNQPGTFRISSSGFLPGGASAGMVYELEDITGNTPLSLERFRLFEDRVSSWRQWQLLNVRYVLSDRDIDGPGLERVYEEDGIKVYRIGDPLPRAWIVHDILVTGDEQVPDLLSTDSFDPKSAALVLPSEKSLALTGGSAAESDVRIIESRPGKLVLDVSSADDGLLVVSQPFYPGWTARIARYDGAQVPIYRVDYLLQGIPVKPGAYRIILDYESSLWPAFISLVVLLGCVVVLFWGLRATRSPNRE